MKMSKMFWLLSAGFLLLFPLAAGAGADTMAQDNTMMDKKAEEMETSQSKMMMQDDGMKKEAMPAKSASESTMTSDSMSDGDMMKDKKMDGMATGKEAMPMQNDGMKGEAMPMVPPSDPMMKSDGK